MVDKSLKFTVNTQELDAKTKAYLFALEQQNGWLAFNPAPIKKEDMKDEPLPDGGRVIKSPSSRYRATIAVFLKKYGERNKRGITQGEIDRYYESQMEKHIDEMKRKINELN
jgi:hypothetical protein